MCLIRSVKWIYRQFFPEQEKKPLIPKDKMVVLRPDGSWILDDNKSSKPPAVPQRVPTPNVSAWHSYGPLDPISNIEVELRDPPSLFPFAQELTIKLTECIAAGVISSCVHKKTGTETYVLTIEIPYTRDNNIANTQINLFVKAMRDKYHLVLLNKRRDVSAISSESYHVLIFEYDPRKKLFEENK
jgi:hypothetical protein